MSVSLTSQQAALLAYITRYLDEHGGVAPSFDEMKDAVGISAKSGVHRLLGALEERGLIRRLPNRARAIEIVGEHLRKVPTRDILAELERRGVQVRKLGLEIMV